MRRATTAALSAGLLVVVLGAPSDHPPVGQAAGAPLRVHRPAPIPPEDPVVVESQSAAVTGSALFRRHPGTSVSLPAAVLAAYEHAVSAAPPECHLTVSVLAAIGQVESGNGAGHRLDAGNRVVPAILGPVLDGRRFAAVADTDAGQWDGNTRWDRALGPLQLIPSTWRAVGVDLDGDGVRDPQDLEDAAGAAMVYLCAGGRDLATDDGLRAAILAYNHSSSYLRLVLAWKAAFDGLDLAAWAGGPLTAVWPATLASPVEPAAVEPVSVEPAAPTPRPAHVPPPFTPAGHGSGGVTQTALAAAVVVQPALTPAPSTTAQPAPAAATDPAADPGTPPPTGACPPATDPGAVATTDPAPPEPTPGSPTPTDPAGATSQPPAPLPDPCSPVPDATPDPTADPVTPPTPMPVG